MTTFFTSDLHLGHNNVLRHRTEFATIEEHDNYIIDRWNQRVGEEDVVYILGDFSFRAERHPTFYLDRMKGIKHLLVGNHDAGWMKKLGEDINLYFQSVEHLKIIKHDKKSLTLCHYPMLEWLGSRYVHNESNFLIHGHIHATKEPKVYGYIRENLPHALNAGVDINDFQPVTLEELRTNCDRWYERKGEPFESL